MIGGIKVKDLKLKISGMHCTGCSTRLEKVLNNVDGIKEAVVDFEKKEANVIYDESKIDISNIKNIIDDAGFKGE